MNAKSSIASPVSAARNGASRETLFQFSLAMRLFSLFAVVIVGGATAFMAILALLSIAVKGDWLGGVVFVVGAGFMASLVEYMASDMLYQWRLRVALEADVLVLDLPAGRSHIHHPPAQHVGIPFTDIEDIETRLEAYRSLGTTAMQRPYVLQRKAGEPIFLFEDRALGTSLQNPFFRRVAADIAARVGVSVKDLGTVEGGGGVLGIWATHAPDWAAASLPAARARKAWRAARRTGQLSLALLMIALILRLL